MTLSQRLRSKFFPMPRSLAKAIACYYSPSKPENCSSLEAISKEKHHISLKQAPSCLSYAHCPLSSLRRTAQQVAEEGWTILGYEKDELDTYIRSVLTEEVENSPSSIASDVSSYLSGENENLSFMGNKLIDGSNIRDFAKVGLEYSNPWPVWASTIWCGVMGKKLPDIAVHFESSPKINMPAPVAILRGLFPSGKLPKKRFTFATRPFEEQSLLIRRKTYWGAELYRIRKDGNSQESDWADTLIKKLNAFLKGKPNPSWNKKLTEKLYNGKDRCIKTRGFRFQEILKSCDGMFIQEWVSMPEEVWDWQRFDRTILKNLNFLLEDGFLDGEMPLEALTHKTNYAYLKDARNSIKSHRLARNLQAEAFDWELLPPDIRYLQRLDESLGKGRGTDQTRSLGTGIQNRGMGNPPPIMKLQSKKKFIDTVTSESKPLTTTEKQLLFAGLEKARDSIPTEAFTGLTTKASLGIKATACWEKTKQSGGTIEAISEIVRGAHEGKVYRKTNLTTGQHEEVCSIADSTVGEYVFWACLDTILHIDPILLRRAFLAVISDPGKARSITKAMAALKIVLDVISHICVWPLHKVESSRSGVSEESHAWNLFADMFHGSGKEVFFEQDNREEEKFFGGGGSTTTTWKDAYAYCSDMICATDSAHHEVGGILGNFWMTHCGLPPVLRAVVNMTCFKPREVYFEASGCFEDMGEPTELEGVRKILTTKGIFMGDPLTKVILHLINILATHIPKLLYDLGACRKTMTNATQLRRLWKL